MLRAILFDIDNTLLDRDAAMGRLLRALIEARPDAFRAPAADLDALLAADERGRRDRASFCGWVCARYPLGLDGRGFWERWASRVAEHVTRDEAVVALVQTLARRFRLGVVSDGGSGRQREKLARLGLADAFVAVSISGETGWEKPDPRAFLAATGSMGCAPGEALFVGDDPWRDVSGARAAGLRTCWVRPPAAATWGDPAWPANVPPPDLVIERVTDLTAGAAPLDGPRLTPKC